MSGTENEKRSVMKEQPEAAEHPIEQESAQEQEPPPDHTARLFELEQALAETHARLKEREAALEATHLQLQSTVARYRQALLSTSPEVPEELVQGDTVEELDASLATARKMVEKVRRQLEARAQEPRMPAGAPPRSLRDFSLLSPFEKIARGLGR
jgi:hypothetical protein